MNPVRIFHPDILHNVSVNHKLRNQGKCPALTVHIDRKKLQDVRMGKLHPEHRFLAKILNLGATMSLESGWGPRDNTYLLNFGNIPIPWNADGFYGHRPLA